MLQFHTTPALFSCPKEFAFILSNKLYLPNKILLLLNQKILLRPLV